MKEEELKAGRIERGGNMALLLPQNNFN